MTRNLLGIVGLVDGAITSLLWGVLALTLIRTFSLQQHWYWVCVLVTLAMAAQQFISQTLAFPAVLRELGYEVTDVVREKMKFRLTDSVVFAAMMFGCAYLGVSSGRL